MIALLPFRGLQGSKSRWPELGERHRRLVLQILTDNYRAVSHTLGEDQVFVVTPDSSLQEYLPGTRLLECPGKGLNQDLQFARQKLLSQEAPRELLVLLPDLPGLRTADVQKLVDAVSSHSVVICPDHQEYGTNAIGLRSAFELDFLFEGGSFHRHLEACKSKSLSHFVLKTEGLAQDCDDLDALRRFSLL